MLPRASLGARMKLRTLATIALAAVAAHLVRRHRRLFDLHVKAGVAAMRREGELRRLLAAERHELDLADARIAALEEQLAAARLEAEAADVARLIAQQDAMRARAAAAPVDKPTEELLFWWSLLGDESRAQVSDFAGQRVAHGPVGHERRADEMVVAAGAEQEVRHG